MVIFPICCVLRVFSFAAYQIVRLNENPCAALPIEKNSSFMDWKLNSKFKFRAFKLYKSFLYARVGWCFLKTKCLRLQYKIYNYNNLLY